MRPLGTSLLSGEHPLNKCQIVLVIKVMVHVVKLIKKCASMGTWNRLYLMFLALY